jgi:hypothetical protein
MSASNLWNMAKADALLAGSVLLRKEKKLQKSDQWLFDAIFNMKASEREQGWPSKEYITSVEAVVEGRFIHVVDDV